MRYLSLVVILMFSVAFTCFAAQTTSYAAASSYPQKTILVTPLVDNSKSKYAPDLKEKINEYYSEKFNDSKFNKIAPDRTINFLKECSISDITSAEKDDLMALGKKAHADYVIVTELQSVHFRQGTHGFIIVTEKFMIATASINVKVLDVQKNTYLYSGTLTEQNKNASHLIGGVGKKNTVMGSLEKVLNILDTKLPPIVG